MENVTLIIQGKLLKECYDFYIENYKDLPVIISTWVGTDIDFQNLPPNFKVILSPIPSLIGPQNINLQIVSTINALNAIQTKYAIKIRGDEYWSNIQYICNSIIVEPTKLHTSPVYFRAWDFVEYHISDHIIAGTTENLKIMFNASYHNVITGKLNVSKHKEDGKFVKYYETYNPEERITKSYLHAKEPFRFEKVDGRILMKEHFEILDIDLLKPYKVVVNLYNKVWYDDFIPEKNFSISNIDKLFSEEPYKIINK